MKGIGKSHGVEYMVFVQEYKRMRGLGKILQVCGTVLWLILDESALEYCRLTSSLGKFLWSAF